MLGKRHDVTLHYNKEGGPPTPLSWQRQAPTPLRFHTPGHRFPWRNDGATLPTQKIRRGEGTCLKCERGYPTPLSEKRVGVPLPPCPGKDRLPPPFRLYVHMHGFAWSHDGVVVSRSVIRQGGGGSPSCARRGTHPLPRSKIREGDPPPPCPQKDRHPPPIPLEAGTPASTGPTPREDPCP